MVPLDDPRWNELLGGYRTPYDPSDALRRLERGEGGWSELWQELQHQGDVGEASYATVPHLVRVAKQLAHRDWNLYALVATIEIERHRKSNPPMPSWLAQAYSQALEDLMEFGFRDLRAVQDAVTIRSILALIALVKDELKLGAIISQCDDSEIDGIAEKYHAWSTLYS